MATFSFENPIYLYLLSLIPLIILIHFVSIRNKYGRAVRFANFEAIYKIKGVDLYSKNIVVLILTVVIYTAIVLSVSGLTIHSVVETSSSAFVLAIDSSRSMEANDFLPNRLEVAKKTATEFVNLAPFGTVIGVISFSGNAVIQQTLTVDKSPVRRSISNIDVSSVGGTDLSEAIVTSTNLLSSEDSKSVILLSDGQLSFGNLDDAVEYANRNGVIIHTIAMGTVIGGNTTYGLSRLDEDSLKAVAYNTGGDYFVATNERELQDNFSDIIELKTRKVSFEISNYLLIAAALLFFLEYFLINTRYKVIP